MAALRIKSQWFRQGTVKTPQQTASAMAFITWRVAQNMLKQMRSAQFDIEIGAQYFSFTRETLVFLLQVLERMAANHMEEAQRGAFMVALVQRVARILQENADGLMGAPAPDLPSHYDSFIDQYNALSDHYADFGFGASSGPDFAFVRYLGHRIEALMPEKDRLWVVDQIMATEVPEAVQMLGNALRDVLSNEPRAPRKGRAAATGD